MSRINSIIIVFLVSVVTLPLWATDKPLDRQAIVARHLLRDTGTEQLLPIGNGNFCFNVDGTGMQTFCGDTLAHWAWHESPLPDGVSPADIPSTGTFQKGRNRGFDVIPSDKEKTVEWLRNNPHAMNLARIRLMRPGLVPIAPAEIQNGHRTLDLWTGIHTASFELDGQPVQVQTVVSNDDRIAIRINSSLAEKRQFVIAVDFPTVSIQGEVTLGNTVHKGFFYGGWTGDFQRKDGHESRMTPQGENGLFIERKIDDCRYNVFISGHGMEIKRSEFPHRLEILPSANSVELVLAFGQKVDRKAVTYEQVEKESCLRWEQYWTTGGAMDLSESTDPRWKELERRIVLSQFQMRTNSAGDYPSAEAGLLGMDPWADRFHMEMVWWHTAHYFLWGREQLADKALQCYQWLKKSAKQLATQLDYPGYQWPKAIGPSARSQFWQGNLILLWKQPHPIFFAELEYRIHPTKATLEKWADVIDGTARWMAAYPVRDEKGVYHLNPVMPPSEQGMTRDTVFDLAYWRFGLRQANVWRTRMGLPEIPEWNTIADNLAPLPVNKDGVFIHSVEWTDTYTKRNWEHPDLVGVLGMLPPIQGVDPAIAKKTVATVMAGWQWDKCWGWDFPWMAMAAARTGQPEIAIDILLHSSPRNRYDERGVNNGMGGNLPYLPGNGGLLYAIAMMAAGWDGCPNQPAPGFPQNGQWKVRFEGLKKAL